MNFPIPPETFELSTAADKLRATLNDEWTSLAKRRELIEAEAANLEQTPTASFTGQIIEAIRKNKRVELGLIHEEVNLLDRVKSEWADTCANERRSRIMFLENAMQEKWNQVYKFLLDGGCTAPATVPGTPAEFQYAVAFERVVGEHIGRVGFIREKESIENAPRFDKKPIDDSIAKLEQRRLELDARIRQAA